MTARDDPRLGAWADLLEQCLAGLSPPLVRRVMVFAETPSTQDAARRCSGGQPVLVVAGRQTAGRGRLGRPWFDDAGLGVSMTLVFRRDRAEAAHLALAAGVALVEGCARAVPEADLGLKWPNDLVDRVTRRKLAGVLVEGDERSWMLGIGVNANQLPTDWDGSPIRDHPPISLREIAGRPIDRLTVIVAIMESLHASIRRPESETIERWRRREVLTGTHAAFEHAGRLYRGVVESVDPTLTLVVRTADGLVRLPALATSVVGSTIDG